MNATTARREIDLRPGPGASSRPAERAAFLDEACAADPGAAPTVEDLLRRDGGRRGAS